MQHSELLDSLAQLRDEQLRTWPLARDNYEALGRVRRKRFRVGALEGAVQFNPARALSTGAKVDSASIKARPCFLCAKNRPAEQVATEIIPDWELLVNPYPIFPLHFTLAHKIHGPQSEIPLEMASMAEKLPGMAIFFNGARAGASAPDHLHCQAVMKSELPLLNYLEEGGEPGKLPFKVLYNIITLDLQGMLTLNEVVKIKGIDGENGKEDTGLVNVFMWIGDDRMLRTAVVIRKAHRPDCYAADGDEGLMVSPGAVDMAGIIITPREADFEKISPEDVKQIYREVAWTLE